MRALFKFFLEDQSQAGIGSKLLKLFVAPEVEESLVLPPAVVPCAKRFNPNYFYFCGGNLPIKEASKHGLVVGTTSSGKSIAVMKPLTRSLIGRVKRNLRRGFGERILIFDFKNDMLPLLADFGLTPENGGVVILNAFDSRGYEWDIAEAVQQPARAWGLCYLIVIKEPNSTAPYFSDAARILIFAVILSLNANFGADWQFRDLIHCLQNARTIIAIVSRNRESAEMALTILRDNKHARAVVASLATKIQPFRQVAALWANNKNGRKFSIREFLKKPGVLVLGYDPIMKESWIPILELFLRCYTDEVLRGPETLEPTNHFVFDEYTSMVKFDKDKTIIDLLELGRSKGACVTLGIQSIAALVEIYKEAGANRILSLLANKMLLRLGDPQSAEWCERYIGKRRQMEDSYSISWGKNGCSSSVSTSLQDRPLMLSTYFMDLPFPDAGKGFCAVCDVPSEGKVILLQQPFEEILSWKAKTPREDGSNRISDPKLQLLTPWTKAERERFTPPAPKKPKPGERKEEKAKPYLPRRKKQDDPNQLKFL